MSKSNQLTQRLAAIAALLLFSAAGATGDNEKRAHDAHEHGHGILNVAADGDELIIELEVPGVNVVGFEHQPESNDQRRAVEKALTTFGRGDMLFRPTAEAACRLEHAEVSLGGERREGGAPEKHGHDEDSTAEIHTALLGEYLFHCDRPDRLHGLEVRVFDHLRDLDELDVQVVTPTTQVAMELEPGATFIKLTD